VINPIKPT